MELEEPSATQSLMFTGPSHIISEETKTRGCNVSDRRRSGAAGPRGLQPRCALRFGYHPYTHLVETEHAGSPGLALTPLFHRPPPKRLRSEEAEEWV
ncbi:hypothetical protein EYF80_044000 [Liparis tanakae]|uniref:Uncharacterized protein n=1 Tax=Liparis tanakae TaxID=230148 RepID=A0A4Z2FY26_9TELE|nr:hypothetical protein EYF80_044000 [Liparis tanakae]